MSRDFYELCYDQYKREIDDANNIYQKAGVLLVIIPIIGSAIFAFGRDDIFDLFHERTDVFLYYVVSLIAVIALFVSIVFLFCCVLPRKYETLAKMDAWHQWHSDYQEYLKNKNEESKHHNDDELEVALFEALCPKLVKAQPVNAKLNETRSKAFKRSLLLASISLFAFFFQAILYFLLYIQGI